MAVMQVGEGPMEGFSIKTGAPRPGAGLSWLAAASAVTATRAFGQTATPAPYRTASELSADLAARRVSAVELLDQTIARIEALDKSINAVVVRDFDRARQQRTRPTRRWRGASGGRCSVCR